MNSFSQEKGRIQSNANRIQEKLIYLFSTFLSAVMNRAIDIYDARYS